MTFHNDLYVFGPLNGSSSIGDWVAFPIGQPSGVAPGPLYGYNAAVLNGSLVISGGFSGNQTVDSTQQAGIIYQYVFMTHRLFV